MQNLIVGIDCAVQPTNVGIALATFDGTNCRVIDARKCGARDLPADAILAWHELAAISLIALDAPLGWPADLSSALQTHSAGVEIAIESNRLFRRTTDRKIYERLGKLPLEVGANFIARTANAALSMLQRIRELTDCTIPLAWKPGLPTSMSAIEVYPAATIRSSGLPIVDYKKNQHTEGRKQMIAAFPKWLDVTSVNDAIIQSSDVLDAVLCIVAAVDFCRGVSVPPKNLELAKQEGWIWAGPPVAVE